MKKNIFLFIFFVSGKILNAQHFEITTKDISNGEVVPFAYVITVKNGIKNETITNEEGRAIINLPIDSLFISHISYKTNISTKLEPSGIITLTPNIQQLEEVIIYNLDLRKKFEFVLKNFNQLYVSGQHTYHCTYKDTYRVNETLTRLSQFQLKWWDKNYNSNVKKSPLSQNQIGIGVTDYSKNRGNDIDGGSLANNSFFAVLHLNNYLLALNTHCKEFVINRIEKTDLTTTIFFNALLELPKKVIGELNDSKVIFENRSGAIIYISTHLFRENNLEEKVSTKKRIPYKIQYIDEKRLMSFVKEKNKYRISHLNYQMNGEVEMLGNTNKIGHDVSIYVTKMEMGNTISRLERVNLTEKVIHEYLVKKSIGNPKILLTKEEMDFINDK